MTLFNLLKIKMSIDLFDPKKCKVTFGFKYTFITGEMWASICLSRKVSQKGFTSFVLTCADCYLS